MKSDKCEYYLGNIFTDILWNFLRNLNIITNNSFQNEYFGDVKQLVTVVRNNMIINFIAYAE